MTGKTIKNRLIELCSDKHVIKADSVEALMKKCKKFRKKLASKQPKTAILKETVEIDHALSDYRCTLVLNRLINLEEEIICHKIETSDNVVRLKKDNQQQITVFIN